MWQRRKDGLCRIPLPALWPGQALGGDELSIVIVPALCESLRGQLGQPGEQSPPRGRDYRHIILTVPAMFRTTFYQNAAVLLSALMRCGVQCLDDFYSEVRGKALKGTSR